MELQETGATAEVIQNKVQTTIDEMIADGTLAALTIADGTITQEKFADDVHFGVQNGEVTVEKLSGTTYEYPGGLGQVNYNDVTDGYCYDSAGTLTEKEGWSISNKMPVGTNTHYYAKENNWKVDYIVFFDSSDAVVSAVKYGQSNIGIYGEIPDGASYARCCFPTGDTTTNVIFAEKAIGTDRNYSWSFIRRYINNGWGKVETIKGAADALVTAYESVKGFISDVVQGFQDAVTWGKEHETTLTLIGVAVGTLTAAIVAYNVAQAIKNAGGIAEIAQLAALQVGLWGLTAAETAHTVATNIATAATTAFGAVMSFVTSPITLVVVAIGALIAIGVLLYKNWDTIKAKCSELWSNVTEKFNNLKESVVGKVTELKDKAVEKFNSLKESASQKFQSLKNSVSEKVQSMKASVSEKFQAMKNTMGTVMQAAKDTVSQKLENIKSAYNKHGGGIKGIAAAGIEGVKGYYTAGYTFIDNLTGGKLSAVASKFKSKMSEAKEAVSSRLSSIKTSFSSGLQGAFSTVSNILGNIKNKFSSVLNSAKSTVSNAISKIKGFFNFSWSLPKLKMPHFSISGKFSLNPLSVPKFSISWYKKAMDEPYMFTKPTIFDVNPVTGQAKGAGEAGDELMLGKNTLLNMIRRAVNSENAGVVQKLEILISILSRYFPEIIEAMKREIVLDSGALVGELAPAMDTELGRISNHKGRGN